VRLYERTVGEAPDLATSIKGARVART
jgi:hypothetical protein